MERIAIVDFFDDQESVALRHSGDNPDAIYDAIAEAFEAEGFDTITLFERGDDEIAHIDADSLPTLFQM